MSSLESTMDLYRQMASNIPDCSIYIFDHEFCYLLAEGEEIAKNGLQSEMLVGSNFFEVWPQEVTRTLAPYYQKTLEGERLRIEQRYNDYYYVQHYIPIKDEKGKVEAGMVVSQNVSELKYTKDKLDETDKELKVQSKLFETVINTVGEGIIVTDRKGEILISNPSAHKILHWDISRNSFKNWEDEIEIFSRPGGRKLAKEELPLNIALHGGTLDGYETFVRNKNENQSFFAENSARPLMNDGRTEGAVVVFRDITARKELDILLRENLETLKYQNRNLNNLLRNVSSNIRSPIANLSILCSLLDKGTTAEEVDLYIQKIKEVSGYLNEVLDSFTEAVILDRDRKHDISYQKFRDFLDEFKMDYQRDILENNVVINASFKAAQGVEYPKKFVKNIFYNLLNNCLRFKSDDRDLKIEMRSWKKDKKIWLSIKDNGKGMDLSRYGDKLFGLHQTFHRGKSNKGLGLFLVKNQLDSMGGTIDVASKPGQGTEFTIKF